jgi:uncharacterized protein (DUF488 family)
MSTVYTIGLERRSLEDLIATLREAGVDAIIDVRLHNTSQLAGFSKRDDFAFLLQEGFGIAYEHNLELAPTEEIMRAYRKSRDWEAYRRGYMPLLAERDAVAVGRDVLSRYQAPCLLCAERDAGQCHRSLIAAHWAEQLPDVQVVHL